MNNTKIDWATRSWNPVTGCLHGCPYCYARKIAERFGTLFKGPQPEDEGLTFLPDEPERFYELDEPVRDASGKAEPFPANFYPTLHRYRLGDPAKMKKPQRIFVGSMADLFGAWVPKGLTTISAQYASELLKVWCKVVEGSGGDTADWSDFRSFDTFMGRYLV